MKFSAAVVAAFAATVLAAPGPAEQVQQAPPGGDENLTLFEQWGGDSKSTRICSVEHGEKKCIEIDSSKGEPEYKCKGEQPGPYKSKCEEEAEKKLIEEYKRKKAFRDFEKKHEFEEWEKKKELEKYLHEHEHKHEWGPDRDLKEFKEKHAFEEYEAKKAYEEYENKKKLEALKEKWEAEEAIDKLCSIKDKDGKCSKKKEEW